MTATSRAWLVPAVVALATAGGCGAVERAWAWVHAQPPPSGWRQARAANGGTLPYPAGWNLVKGDPGTVSAALRDGKGRFLGYLNLTPRQGDEHRAGWASFRARHNRAEGNRDVRVISSADELTFRTGKGACVRDSYVTSSGMAYVEVACLIEGRHPSVVVGAAPPGNWSGQAADIERAISGVSV